MKKLTLFSFVLLAFSFWLLTGCSSKKYYEATNIQGKLSLSKTKSSALASVASNVATLENGKVILNEQQINLKLPVGYEAISFENEIIFAFNQSTRDLKMLTTSGELVFEKKFQNAIVSANMKNNILAIVYANNALELFDIQTNKVLYFSKLSDIYAINASVASPKFLDKLVVLPALNGKLYIVDLQRYQLVQNILVSDAPFLNNIIFLEMHNDFLIAATPYKVVSIGNDKFQEQTSSIKTILVNEDKVYLFQKNGTVKTYNFLLEPISKVKLPFAMISYAKMVDNTLYVVEKTGYLIQMDKTLNSVQVKELPSDIEKNVFIAQRELIVGDKYLTLP